MRVLAGPPGAGKSRYAYRHLSDGEIVIDPDEILVALVGRYSHHYVGVPKTLVRDAKKALARWAVDDGLNGWYLTSDPRPEKLRQMAQDLGGPVHVIMPKRQIVMQRVLSRPVMPGDLSWSKLVDRWYRLFRWDPTFVRLPS